MLQQFLKDCDEYKTESEYSESTVASEIAERKIDLFTLNNITDDQKEQVHLHIEALNINYGQTEAVSQLGGLPLHRIDNNVAGSSGAVKTAVNSSEPSLGVKRKNSRTKVLIISFLAGLLLLVVAGFILVPTFYIVFKEKVIWLKMDKLMKIPPECVVASIESSANYNGPVHIGRTRIDKEVVIGKVIDDWKTGYFPKDGKEIKSGDYEVLCVRNYSWVSKDSDLKNAIAGGFSGDGDAFYVCRAKHVVEGKTFEIPGKLFLRFNCCYVGFYELEYCYHDYLVLITT